MQYVGKNVVVFMVSTGYRYEGVVTEENETFLVVKDKRYGVVRLLQKSIATLIFNEQGQEPRLKR